MIEFPIIAASMGSRHGFDTIKQHISKSSLSPMGRRCFDSIENYYASDTDADRIDLPTLMETLVLKYPKDNQSITEYLLGVPEFYSTPNIVNILLKFKKNILLEAISTAYAREQTADVDDLVKEYTDLSINGIKSAINGTVYHKTLLSEALSQSSSGMLIPIYPSHLNDLLGGGIPRQSNIGICARPDVGKSTIAINLAGGMLLNGYKVLYIGNEDAESRMIARVISRITGVPFPEIIKNPEKYEELAIEKGYHNFVFAGLYPGTLTEIRQLVEEYTPDILVVDQIKNLNISSSAVENLELGAKGTRDLAKQFNMVSIAVTQAGDSAEQKLNLDMGDVYNSNTGFQGALDLLIAAGQNQDFKRNGRVMLSFPKNKLSAPIEPIACKIDYITNKIMTYN